VSLFFSLLIEFKITNCESDEGREAIGFETHHALTNSSAGDKTV